jgi:MFS family permease
MTERLPMGVAPPSPSGIWKPPLGRLTLGLALAVVATAFEALAVATILPATVRELGGIAWYGWTFSAFMLANLVGISVGGSETDRGGPSKPFVVGTCLFTGGLVLSGLAPSMGVIVAGRTAQGFGAGLLSAVAYASIARAYASDLQPRMLATLSSAWVVPGLVGPGLSGVIAQHAGWRWVFLGLAPMPVLAALLVVPALAKLPVQTSATAPAAPEPGRIWLALQLAGGACAALVGVGLRPWWLALVLASSGSALALRALSRLWPSGTLVARPGAPAAIAAMTLLTFAFFGTEAFLPLALTNVRGQSLFLVGAAFTAAALSWTLGAWLPVRLVPQFGRRAIVVVGLCVLGLAIVGVWWLLSPRLPPQTAVAAWGVAGFGMGLAFTTLSAAILEAAPAGQEGAASASLSLAQVLGAALGTGAGGAIVVAPFAGEPPSAGIAVVDLLMLVVLGLALLASRGVRDVERRAIGA